MSGAGITTKIRQRLNFTNELVWKQFSARRLKLIEDNQLHYRKASDQDFEVKHVAETLRQEFNLPVTLLDDIDKLVRAAIQSIRRNRKRSSKSKKSLGNNFIIIGNSFQQQQHQPKRQKKSFDKTISEALLQTQLNTLFEHKPEDGIQRSNNVENNSANKESGKTRKREIDAISQEDNIEKPDPTPQKEETLPHLRSTVSDDNNGECFINDIMNVEGLKTSSAPEPHEYLHAYSKKQKISHSDVSKNAISSFIQPVIDGSSIGISSKTPQSARDSELINTIRINSLYAKKNFLNLIKKSKTCSLSTKTNLIVNKESNVYYLGRSIIPSIIAFLLCKNFPLDADNSSIEYLRMKLNSPEVLAKILKSLDYESPDIKLMSDDVAVDTLYYLVGCCIIDFRFNEIADLVSGIFCETIVTDFPMIQVNSLLLQQENYANKLKYQYADSDNEDDDGENVENHVKKVEIRFNKNALNFKFDSRVSATPTVLEVLVNCKKAFNIVSDSKILGMRDMCNNGKIVNNDFELEQIFLKYREIVIELCFVNEVEAGKQGKSSIQDDDGTITENSTSRYEQANNNIDNIASTNNNNADVIITKGTQTAALEETTQDPSKCSLLPSANSAYNAIPATAFDGGEVAPTPDPTPALTPTPGHSVSVSSAASASLSSSSSSSSSSSMLSLLSGSAAAATAHPPTAATVKPSPGCVPSGSIAASGTYRPPSSSSSSVTSTAASSPPPPALSLLSEISLLNPYRISSIQSYARSTSRSLQNLKLGNRQQDKTFIPPRFEKLL